MSKQFIPRDCTTNLTEMESFLSKNNFLSGSENPGQIDSQMIDLMLKGGQSSEMQVPPDRNRYPNSFSWFWSLSQFSYKTRKLWNPLNISPNLTDSEEEAELEPGGVLCDSIETEPRLEGVRIEGARQTTERDEFVVSLDNGEYYGFMENDRSFKMSSISHPKSNSTQSNNLECRSIMKHLDNDQEDTTLNTEKTIHYYNFEEGKSADLGVQKAFAPNSKVVRGSISVRAESERTVPVIVNALNQPLTDGRLHIKEMINERENLDQRGPIQIKPPQETKSDPNFEKIEKNDIQQPKSLPSKPNPPSLNRSENEAFLFNTDIKEEMTKPQLADESTGIFRVQSTSRKSNTSQNQILSDIDIARNYSYSREPEFRNSKTNAQLPNDVLYSPETQNELLKSPKIESNSNIKTPHFGASSHTPPPQNFFGEVKNKIEFDKSNTGNEKSGSVIQQFSEFRYEEEEMKNGENNQSSSEAEKPTFSETHATA